MSLYLPDLDALFIHIPKTGGTWVKEVLSKSMRVEPAKGAGSHNLPWRYNHPTARKFCFVRHPLTWYESIWMGLHSSWPSDDRHDRGPLFNEPAFSPVRLLTRRCGEREFTAFIERVLEREPGFVSRMYEWYVGPPGAPLVDFVGRMEQIEIAVPRILKQLGWRGALPVCPVVNAGPGDRPQWPESLQQRVLAAEMTALQWFYLNNEPSISIEAQ